MKSRFAMIFHAAVTLLFAGTAFSATTSVNTGSLLGLANGTNSDTVTVTTGVLGGDDKAAGYPTPASPPAITTISFQAGLNPASGSPFTIEFWANPASTAANPNSSPVSNRVSASPRSGWAFFQRTDNLGWSFIMYNGTGSTAGWDLTGGTSTVNQWSHVVATWTGAAAALYVNGLLVDDTNSGAGGYNASTTATFAVGGLADSSSPFRGGAVDEVAFYGSALSPAQILNHYNLVGSNPSAYQSTVLADGALLQLTNVPEPASAVLAGLGGLLLLRRRSR
jgi:hypothetical protein